jgi:hypothetical protein
MSSRERVILGVPAVGLSGSLAMVLVVIFSLDTPFTGDMGIGPDSYQLIDDPHMRSG